jgi:glycosyltransferase involved in cell wall biosynthesis
MAREPIRVLSVIARLNIGGAAIQVISLAALMQDRGYATRLVRGSESPDEGNMNELAERMGVEPTLVASLRRDPGPGDVRALVELVRIARRDRPAVVHTHAAKGGTLGRAAVMLAYPRRGRRPAVVHTFHGHSLTGYFSPRKAQVFQAIERFLARRTDVLVAVSEEVRDELVALGVAPAAQFEVIPVGLDLADYTDDEHRAARRAALRAVWGIAEDEHVVTLVARLVPIKRVDRFLEMAALLRDRARTRFVIVGDGELRDELRASPAAQALGDHLVWAGFRSDMPDVCFASDVVVLTSDNEGTPMSLLEAQAAATPVVSTNVGGVRSAVVDGATGRLADDAEGLAAAVAELLDDPARAAAIAASGRKHVLATFGIERLLDDHNALYRRLLS